MLNLLEKGGATAGFYTCPGIRAFRAFLLRDGLEHAAGAPWNSAAGADSRPFR
jgi:hypothetical protein